MKVRRKIKTVLAGASALVGLVASAATVTIDKVQQRWPWNGKVDVSYTLSDLDSAKHYDLTLTFTAAGKTSSTKLTNLTAGQNTHVFDGGAAFAGIANTNITVKAALNEATMPDTSGIVFADKSVTYNGSAQSLSYTGSLPTGVSSAVITYTLNGASVTSPTEVGSYAATLTFVVSNEQDFVAPAPLTAVLTIASAPPGDATGPAIGIIGDVMVIDLTGGRNATSYPVTYYNGVDTGLFNVYAYKNTKIAFRKIKAGTYPSQPNSNEVVTRQVEMPEYWMGLFEITQGQYSRLYGSATVNSATVASMDYTSTKNIESALGNLSEKAGFGADGIRLPTDDEWEVAARAGSTAVYGHYFDTTTKKAVEGNASNVSKFAWHDVSNNFKGETGGKKAPNLWGFYDMMGNFQENCISGKEGAHCMFCSEAYPSYALRGGSFYPADAKSRPSIHYHKSAVQSKETIGFRACCVISGR